MTVSLSIQPLFYLFKPSIVFFRNTSVFLSYRFYASSKCLPRYFLVVVALVNEVFSFIMSSHWRLGLCCKGRFLHSACLFFIPSPQWSFIVFQLVFCGFLGIEKRNLQKPLPNCKEEHVFSQQRSGLMFICFVGYCFEVRIMEGIRYCSCGPHIFLMLHS